MNTKPRLIVITGWLILAIVLYVLSVGPAVRFGAARSLPSGMRPGNFVGQVWKPVLALEDTKARPLYRAYMKLWGVTYYDTFDAPQ